MLYIMKDKTTDNREWVALVTGSHLREHGLAFVKCFNSESSARGWSENQIDLVLEDLKKSKKVFRVQGKVGWSGCRVITFTNEEDLEEYDLADSLDEGPLEEKIEDWITYRFMYKTKSNLTELVGTPSIDSSKYIQYKY